MVAHLPGRVAYRSNLAASEMTSNGFSYAGLLGDTEDPSSSSRHML